MIKPLILLFDFLVLAFVSLFSGPLISIEHKVPHLMVQGKKSEIQVVITKGVTEGFAKLDIQIPAGFVATASDTKGASFTFSENQARFIWMSLPLDESFTISYFLETMQSSGTFNISGRFSFIDDNVRRDHEIEAKSFVVQMEAVAASEKNAIPSMPSMPLAAGPMQCMRSISKMSDTEFKVELKIANSELTGFAKILETLPQHCKAEKISDAGAVVTIDAGTIKFVWFDIPKIPEINVSYRMTFLTPQDGEPAITGKLSYIKNNTPMDLAVESAGMSTEPLATNTDQGHTHNTQTEPQKTNNAEVVYTDPKTEVKPESKPEPKPEPKINQPKNENKTATTTPDPETGLSYKVQILAAHRVVGKAYFAAVHNYGEKFSVENHEGWVKYTTGKFSEYRQARDERERLKNAYSTLPGPFVTAYSNGDRITVQEALLISKQQWYQ